MSTNSNRKIDVHAHYLPEGYEEEMRKGGVTHPDGMPGYPKWSVDLALETYEKYGIVPPGGAGFNVDLDRDIWLRRGELVNLAAAQ